MAFTNAKIYVTPTNIIKKGTLLVKDGKVVQASNSVKIPRDAKIIDLSGKVVYPSFVDIYTDFGVKKPKGLEVITEDLNMMQVERAIIGTIISDPKQMLVIILTLMTKKQKNF